MLLQIDAIMSQLQCQSSASDRRREANKNREMCFVLSAARLGSEIFINSPGVEIAREEILIANEKL